MASEGEGSGSVMRVGGWAGLLGGVILLIGFILFAAAPPPTDLEQTLATFSDRATNDTVLISLFLVGLLLLLPFVAGLYVSLKEPSRGLARIGLYSGIFSFVVTIVALQAILVTVTAFSGLYTDAASADRPIVVAAYGAVASLTNAGNSVGFLFGGLAFVAFGLAMRGSPAFSEGFTWLSIILGIVVVLFALLAIGPVSIAAAVVFALVFGWKLTSLSGSM